MTLTHTPLISENATQSDRQLQVVPAQTHKSHKNFSILDVKYILYTWEKSF